MNFILAISWWIRSGIFVYFEQILHIVVVFNIDFEQVNAGWDRNADIKVMWL